MATAKGPGRGRLPSPENLINKTPAELIRTLDRFGLAPDLNSLYTRANRAFERLDQIIDERGFPDEATWEAIDKQIERETGQWLRQQVKSAMNTYKLSKLPPKALLTWVGVGDENMCPSCESRHGEQRTLAQWKALGLPGSPVLLCSKECRCGLHQDP